MADCRGWVMGGCAGAASRPWLCLLTWHSNGHARHRHPPRVNLRVVLERKDLLLPEGRVVVKAQLGVGRQQPPLWRLCKRVDLRVWG